MQGATTFELPSNIIRFIEFKEVVVFLLDNYGKRDTVVGVKFSQAGGINHFYIAWEFKSIDGLGDVYSLYGLTKEIYNNKEAVYCYSGGFSVEYFLDPETGKTLVRNEVR
jgi:hypothetical protein